MILALETPNVTAVTVSWNDAENALRCVESLRASDWPDLDILVVDNGSRADSIETLTRGLSTTQTSPPVRLPENTGYTGGFNVGMKQAVLGGADFVILVNSDAVIAPDAISRLVEAAHECANAALIGAVILVAGADDVVLTAGGSLDDRWEVSHDRVGDSPPQPEEAPRAVDFVSGCVVLVRVSALPAMGYLDEDYFAYYEDVDWCLRARSAGYAVFVAASARAWHPDTRLRDEHSAAVTYYMTRNKLLLARKHAPALLPSQYWRIIRTGLSWTLRPKWRGRRAQRNALLGALVDDVRGYRGPWREGRRSDFRNA